jgi:pyridoxamine 5'-phosphate oxidase
MATAATETGTTNPTGGTALRDTLRGLPVLTGSAPPFDPERTPPDPSLLFTEWLTHAITSGVAEPHAMTLSTVDSDGRPHARVLILKDLDAAGWHFAVSSVSPKGRQMTANPVAALTFYWPQLGRQVRVTGDVIPDPRGVTDGDFLARAAGSRAMALTLRQSQPFTQPADLDAALQRTQAQLAETPDVVPDEWTSYAVRADIVEFWQSDTTRRHTRVRYQRSGDGWSQQRLWP